jgi:5-methyltetrahydrofolate--homocysteine methyltransferase
MTKLRLLRELTSGTSCVLTDGAWGTALLRRMPGLRLPALAVLDAPDVVLSIAREYLAAGAELLSTDTFRASPCILSKHGREAACEALNAQAVTLAREAGADCILGSIAPLSQESGTSDPPWLREQFMQQAAGLVRGGCRTALLETFSDIGEACIAMRACRDAGMEEIVCSLFTSGAEQALRAFEVLTKESVDFVGVNCVAPEEYPPGAVYFRPNAGKPGAPIAPAPFAEAIAQAVAHGAGIVGGCCGATPAHIAAVRAVLTTPR